MQKALAYIGALGPKRRTENLLRELQSDGSAIQPKRIKKPLRARRSGHGAATPETIALSIIAEINSVLSNRTGGFLRERRGSIYDRQLIKNKFSDNRNNDFLS